MNTVASPAHARKGARWFPSDLVGDAGQRFHGHTERWSVLVPALVDILLVGSSGIIAYHLRFPDHFSPLSQGIANFIRVPNGRSGMYLGFLMVYAALLVLVAHSQKLYSGGARRSPIMESLLVVRAVLVATVILTAFIFVSGINTVSRLVVGFTAVFSFVLLSGWRLWQCYLTRQRLAKGIGLRHAVIIGAGDMGMMVADYLQANPILGYDFRGFLDANHHEDPRILGKIEDLSRVARQEFIDEVFISIPSERELVKQLALEAMRLNLDVKVIPELYDGLAWQCPLEFVGDVPIRALHREPIPALGLFLKRLTDIVGSALGLVLLSPLLILLALVIKFDSRGPVFYKAYRMGKKGHKFLCYKFRTMVPNAEGMKDDLKHLNERNGPFFKISNDPRLTSIGGFLRKYSLDELPQLWNVFKGEMSLVGPRPPSPDEFKIYALDHFRRLDVTPGITCLWQTEARHDPSFEKAVALDSKYIENWSYLLDLRILLRTIPILLKGTGR